MADGLRGKEIEGFRADQRYGDIVTTVLNLQASRKFKGWRLNARTTALIGDIQPDVEPGSGFDRGLEMPYKWFEPLRAD